MICLLTGPVGCGKTLAASRLADVARQRGPEIGGVLSLSRPHAGGPAKYVHDLARGVDALLADTAGPGTESVGRFRFHQQGLELGRHALAQALRERPKLVIIDEVGPLELRGGGWAEAAEALVDGYRVGPGLLVVVVRKRLLERLQTAWALRAAHVIHATDSDALQKLEMLLRDPPVDAGPASCHT